jgi:hypothetical protein
MKAAALTLAVAAFSTAAAAVEIPDELRTTGVAVLCVDPLNLSEAAKAASFQDKKWMREILCLMLPVGLPAIRISPKFQANESRPLQVRISQPDGSGGVTLWGYASNFATKEGVALDDLFRQSAEEARQQLRLRSQR